MTNNVQTPGGNTTTAGAVEMARRIAAGMPGLNPLQRQAFLDGEWDNAPTAQCALAAIIETTEAAANWAIEVYGSGKPDESTDGDCIAFDLREGAHLKGPSHDDHDT